MQLVSGSLSDVFFGGQSIVVNISSTNLLIGSLVIPPKNWDVTRLFVKTGGVSSSPVCRARICASNSDGTPDLNTTLATSSNVTMPGYSMANFPITYSMTANTMYHLIIEYVSGGSVSVNCTSDSMPPVPHSYFRSYFYDGTYLRWFESTGILVVTSSYGSHGATYGISPASSFYSGIYNDSSSYIGRHGTKIIPNFDMVITAISFHMRKIGAPTGWWTCVEVYNDSNTLLSTSDLKPPILVHELGTNFSTVPHTFSAPVILNKNTPYKIVCRAAGIPAGDASNYVQIGAVQSYGDYGYNAYTPFYKVASRVSATTDANRFTESTTGGIPHIYLAGRALVSAGPLVGPSVLVS